MKSLCIIALFVLLSISAITEARKSNAKRLPKEGKIEVERVKLDDKNCAAKKGLCEVQLYEFPKRAGKRVAKHSLTFKVETQAPVQTCLYVLDKPETKDLDGAISSRCGFGGVELSSFQDQDKLFLAVSLDNSFTFNLEDRKVEYAISYSYSLEDAGKPTCRNGAKYCSKAGDHTGEMCLTKKFVKTCKATCSSIGIDYEECVAPTPKDVTELTACRIARLAALDHGSDEVADAAPSCNFDGSFVISDEATDTDTDTGDELVVEDSSDEDDFVELVSADESTMISPLYSGIAGILVSVAAFVAYSMRKRKAPLSEQDDTPSAI